VAAAKKKKKKNKAAVTTDENQAKGSAAVANGVSSKGVHDNGTVGARSGESNGASNQDAAAAAAAALRDRQKGAEGWQLSRQWLLIFIWID